MTPDRSEAEDFLARAAEHARQYRLHDRPRAPVASAAWLRDRFCGPLPEHGVPGSVVVDELVAAAEPGLVPNTGADFYAWVMGGSNLVGVAADWLTAAWGQNAAIFQSSPAAAIAEEAVEAWLLDLLDLPRESSVGFVTGATTAAFVGLAAARGEVLSRAGHDFDVLGLQGAPQVGVFLSEDAHVTNYAALRQLGFGDANFHRLPSDAAGLMHPKDLSRALARFGGPAIVVAQAGHINSGGFEPLHEIAGIARAHDAWMHVDGAFGLWARASATRRHLAAGAELADSWSVDGHKWLQIPYDSGFAIVRDRVAHRRAMQKTAGYLNADAEDGRNPSAYAPGLSTRARGFAAWAVIRSLGRSGVQDLVDRLCVAASVIANRIRDIDGLVVSNRVELNQVIVTSADEVDGRGQILALADRLNADGRIFVRTATWQGRTVLRLSVISQETTDDNAIELAEAIRTHWLEVQAAQPRLVELTA